MDVPSRTFTWTLEYPLVIFFTPRITLDMFAVGVLGRAMDQGMRIWNAGGHDGREKSERLPFGSDDDRNGAAGGVVGQVELRNWAGRCVWSSWQATASFRWPLSVSFSYWSVGQGASRLSKYRYSG